MKTTELYLKFVLVIVTLCSCTHTSSVGNEYLYMSKDELKNKIKGGVGRSDHWGYFWRTYRI